eukprot:TRINITY_DN11008_c1_g2_i1.p1 TRINITY_DN11008_c1_g2~~TRINITY_DN11008_c1_g2_i1.p1  ORF type:complete len:552 (-),score=112.08 TRINITY_DN11008_c1_g2_i1:213-1868(-)
MIWQPTAMLALLLLLSVASLLPTGVVGDYPTRHVANISVETYDKLRLQGNLYFPVSNDTAQLFPVVVFPNSWDVPAFEYILQAHRFAEDGFICFEYTARGWYESQGYIDVAGPDDARDISTIIDFLLASNLTRPDPDRVGMAGISYGAGLSLLGAAHDPRVKAVVAMSGWESLMNALYGGDTVNLVWGTLLVDTGAIHGIGREPPYLKQIWASLKAHQNISGITEWAVPRSPRTYLDAFNSRNVPVYISNNLEDRLFKPQYVLDFWNALTSPKRIDLNQGIHASAELGGLVDQPNNYVWGNAKLWLQHWLQGVDNGITRQPPFNIQHRKLAGEPDRKDYLRFWQWPSPSNVTNATWTLLPRGGKARFGELVPMNGSVPSQEVDTYQFDEKSGMSAGIPIIGPILQIYVDIPIKCNLGDTSRSGSIAYLGPILSARTYIAGLPTAELWIVPSAPRVQVVAYLYSVDDLTKEGILLDHATQSLWDVEVNAPVRVFLYFRLMAFDVDKGRRLALGLNAYTDLYEAPSKGPYSITVLYGEGKQPQLHLPVYTGTQ